MADILPADSPPPLSFAEPGFLEAALRSSETNPWRQMDRV